MNAIDVSLHQDGTFTTGQPVTVTICGVDIIVKAGLKSDGASIPHLLHSIVGPPVGANHIFAAIVHDHLCIVAKDYADRVFADGVFFALLTRYGVPVWKRTVLYLGVRIYARLKYSCFGKYV